MPVGTPTSVMAASWSRAKAPRALGMGYAPLPVNAAGSPPVPAPAVFPYAPLGVRVELYTGVWTDVSAFVYQRDPITITAGRDAQSSQLSPSNCNLTLQNAYGRFSFNNPLGAYYGQLVRNAPLRVSVPTSVLPAPYNTSYLRLEGDTVSNASCPNAAGIRVTGSLDVRVDVDLTGFGHLTLASMWSAAAGVDERCWRLGMTDSGQLAFSWSTAGTIITTTSVATSALLPIAFGRMVIRVTLDAATGSITFYTAPAGGVDAGPWTQFGTTITGSGATSVFASTKALLQIGYSDGSNFDNTQIGGPAGSFYDAEVRKGIAGAIVAQPVFNALTETTTSWTDAYGNSWTVGGTAEISARNYRAHGEFAGVPKQADPTATDVYSQASAAGILRRLQQGQSPLNSPMYRAIVRATGSFVPVAYWPFEDSAGSTQIASGLSGAPAMQVSGSPQFASNSDFRASGPLPALNKASMSGNVPSAASWTGNNMFFFLEVPSGGDTDGATVTRMNLTGGTAARMDLIYNTTGGGELTLKAFDAGGTLLGAAGPATQINGLPLLILVQLTASGGTLTLGVTYSIAAVGVASTGITGAAATFTGTVGAVTSVQINRGGSLAGTAVGHVAVGTASLFNAPPNNSLSAWFGESAAGRIARLCAEEGIACRIYGHAATTQLMGYQGLQTLPTLLQDCENTDRGMLYELPQTLGIGYRTVASMYNQTPTAVISYAASHLDKTFGSTADDLMTINDVTAVNSDGSTARQVLTSGAMSILAPPNGVGRVDGQVPVNACLDSQLQSLAGWALHIGTDPHDRFPSIPLRLARPSVPNSVALLRIGDLHTITSPPSWVQVDEIDQLVAGRTEALGPVAVWDIATNAIPAYPYMVAELAGGVSPATHVDTDGSVLAASMSASTLSVSVATTDPTMPVWTANPSDFPFDLAIGGERMTAVGPGVTLGTDPFCTQGAANYAGQNAAAVFDASLPWNVDGAAAAQYSTGSLLVTPAGSPALYADVIGQVTAAGSIAANTSYTIWGWVNASVSRSYQLFANWVLNGVYQSTALATGVTVPVGAWTFVSGTVTSPVSGVNEVGFGVSDQASPTVAMSFHVWGLNMAPTASISAAPPQTFGVVRSINGVVKGQSAGADVRLWFPPIVGL